ncbi:hypothetical protein AB1Y20_010981 [Prymnesium parvum]|uniref:Uncharacterized protein n=1 Tax=Prymnesium parvum TaxID=97485 RepID=A0AB34IN17_PRYPA
MAEASPAPPPAAAAAEALEETTPLPQIEPLPALHPPLHQMLEQLQQHLALPADLLPPALVDEAARLLAVAPHGSLLLRAQACHAALFGDPSAPPLVRGAPIAVAVGVRIGAPLVGQSAAPPPAAAEEEEEARPTRPSREPAARRLVCETRGTSYESFRGEWQLCREAPQFNQRPHYTHAVGGTPIVAHLFHCRDPHHGVPRWVIGPTPGDNNGWGFCESAAMLPTHELPDWNLWDGTSWHSGCDLRFILPDRRASREVKPLNSALCVIC